MVRSGASQEEIINFFFTRVVIEIEEMSDINCAIKNLKLLTS